MDSDTPPQLYLLQGELHGLESFISNPFIYWSFVFQLELVDDVTNISHLEHLDKVLVFLTRKQLGESICHHLACWHPYNLDSTLSNLLP